MTVKHCQCPRCNSSSKVTKRGFAKRSNSKKVQIYFCHSCQRNFQLESYIKVLLSAEESCPSCGSNHTVKWRKPKSRKYGQSQCCKCRDCGRHFTKNARKPLRFYLNGKRIYTFWDPPGLQHLPNYACLNCGQEKVVLGRQYFSKQQQKQIYEKVCLSCGTRFSGGKKTWNAQTFRLKGKEVPRQPWNFEHDKWDLRTLYPSFDSNKIEQFFLYFNSCGDDWFKKLLKHYALEFIKQGGAFGTLRGTLNRLRHFGRYLQKKGVAQMNDINREFMGF